MLVRPSTTCPPPKARRCTPTAAKTISNNNPSTETASLRQPDGTSLHKSGVLSDVCVTMPSTYVLLISWGLLLSASSIFDMLSVLWTIGRQGDKKEIVSNLLFSALGHSSTLPPPWYHQSA